MMKLKQLVMGSVAAVLLTSALGAPASAQPNESEEVDGQAVSVTHDVSVPLSDLQSHGGVVGTAPVGVTGPRGGLTSQATLPGCGYRIGTFTWSYRNCDTIAWKLVWRPATSPFNYCTTMWPGSYVYNMPKVATVFVRSDPGKCSINTPIG